MIGSLLAVQNRMYACPTVFDYMPPNERTLGAKVETGIHIYISIVPVTNLRSWYSASGCLVQCAAILFYQSIQRKVQGGADRYCAAKVYLGVT